MEEMRYYLDTCIWIDYFENRRDRFRPLGEWAIALIKYIITSGGVIICSDLIEQELERYYSKHIVQSRFSIVPLKCIMYV